MNQTWLSATDEILIARNISEGRYQFECRACGKIIPVYVRSIQ